MIYPLNIDFWHWHWLKHWNNASLSIFMVHYGINKIKLAFDEQYKIVILQLFTYLVALALALVWKKLASNLSLLNIALQLAVQHAVLQVVQEDVQHKSTRTTAKQKPTTANPATRCSQQQVHPYQSIRQIHHNLTRQNVVQLVVQEIQVEEFGWNNNTHNTETIEAFNEM